MRLNKKLDPKDSIVIFSEARGGSTWVMELLQNNSKKASIFEPLWGKNGAFKKIATKYSSPFYFGSVETEELLKEFISNTLNGKKVSWRTLQFNSFEKVLFSRGSIIKMVNVNLIAPWFVNNFQLKYKPIYLLRHPLAILSSREKYGYGNKDFQDFESESFDWSRIKSSHHPYNYQKPLFDKYSTKWQRYLLEWCIRNFEFLERDYDKNFNILYYEELIINREESANKISQEYQFKKINSDLLLEESGTTSLTDNVYSSMRQLKKWESNFSDREKKIFQDIFNEFSIERYSAYSPLPKHLQFFDE